MDHLNPESIMRMFSKLNGTQEKVAKGKKYLVSFMAWAITFKGSRWAKDTDGIGDILRALTGGKVTVNAAAVAIWKKQNAVRSYKLSHEEQVRFGKALCKAAGFASDAEGNAIRGTDGKPQLAEDEEGNVIAPDNSDLLSLSVSPSYL